MKMVSLVVIVILNLFSPLGKSSVFPQRAPPLTYFTITECMTTSVILAYPMENDQFSNDSSRIRTYDRLLRRQLLCPAELLSQSASSYRLQPWTSKGVAAVERGHMFVCASYLFASQPLYYRVGSVLCQVVCFTVFADACCVHVALWYPVISTLIDCLCAVLRSSSFHRTTKFSKKNFKCLFSYLHFLVTIPPIIYGHFLIHLGSFLTHQWGQFEVL